MSKLKNNFNFGGKVMVTNLKNFYEDFLNNNTKTGTKVNFNKRSENELIKFPTKTLEKMKDNYKSCNRK